MALKRGNIFRDQKLQGKCPSYQSKQRENDPQATEEI